MKKILVAALVAVSVQLVSCDNQSVSPDSITSDMLDLASGGGGKPTGQNPQGGPDGDRPQLTEIAITDLSSYITNYITTNYSDATIEKTGSDPEGNILVSLSLADGTHKGLQFDANGEFVKEMTKPEGGPGKGNGGNKPPQLTDINISTLSSTITAYAASNYAEYSIEKAGTDPEGKTIVLLSTSDKKLGILFDASGTFEKELPPPPQKGGK